MNKLQQNSISYSQSLSIGVIRIYQHVRPILDRVVFSVFGIASECKHQPTCSEYTIGYIRSHGTIAGVVAGFTRILACR